ncbi:glutathione-disulfide reductase [Synechococcus sp. M16CYN]|uniref:glutathione-disulfide reductase n=1 Tax=Synechococcus sp. M16CYN TaxID=3103139 RepID=UPI0032500B9D
MESPFDLVVLGAGSGGLAAAKRASRYGAKVAIVEGDRVGGTCVIRGCVPKKLLVYGAQARHQLRDGSAYGLTLGTVRSDVSELFRRVRAEVDRLNALHLDFLDKAGVELVTGWGQFMDPNTIGISVERGGAVERQLSAAKFLIAVGGRPVRPEIPGIEYTWVSDDIFKLTDLPKRMIVVGAGFVACEFACILQGLGVAITQVVRGRRLLRGFDEELAAAVLDGMHESGIEVLFRSSVAAVRGTFGQLSALLSEGGSVPCDAILMATGRRPWLQGLGLERADIAVQEGRIQVDAESRTSMAHIYAVGDVTDRVNLTPVAIDEGRAFADSVFSNRHRKVDHNLVASAVFSNPELATVGLSEEDAIARYSADGVLIYRCRFRSMARALPATGPLCLLKLVVRRETELVLGCHMVGEHAAEIIQMAAIAVGMGATKADFDRTMALHPSVSEEFVTMS